MKDSLDIIVDTLETVEGEMCRTTGGTSKFLAGIHSFERELNAKALAGDPLEGPLNTWTDATVSFDYSGTWSEARQAICITITEGRFLVFDIGVHRITKGICPVCGIEPIGADRPNNVLPFAGDRCLKTLHRVREGVADRLMRVPWRYLSTTSPDGSEGHE